MSQQTRIDQFYKSTISKKVSNTVMNVKNNSKLKNTPYSRHKKKKNNQKQNILLSQGDVKSKEIPNCSIVYKTDNETYDIDSDVIEMLFQNDDKIESNESSMHKNNYIEESPKKMIGIKSPLSLTNDTMNNVKEKMLNDNEIHLRTPVKEVESSLRTNGRTSSDNKKGGTPLSSVQTITLDDKDNIHIKRTPNKKFRTSDNNSSSSKKLNYSPKLSSSKSLRNISPKKLFGHTIDTDIISQAIEHMNLAKQGAIPPNKFYLNEIYSNGTFEYQYSHINTKTSVKYELSEIISPNDLNSKILFTTIFTVFSNPVNCGYFDENELDFIYSIVTLSLEAQMLLSRMIKRKRTWYRKSNINYPEIASNLDDVFKLLVSRSICTFDIKNEDLSTILNLLQVNEICQLCRNMKIDHNGKKESNISKLIKLSKKKSLFAGMKTPSSALYTYIFDILDYCVCITDRTWNIIDRIMTLLIPNQDPKLSIADTFYMLCDIYLGKIVFPNAFENCFPIFSSKLHLLSYVQARFMLFTTLQFIDKKDWEKVRHYGNLAMDELPKILQAESLSLKNSTLPMHVRRFMPGYTWLKILSKSIDAFKKDKTKKRVVEILNFLLKQDCHMCSNKGRWYSELALIEMYHHKDAEASALVTMQALQTETLSRVDKVDLIERANKILKKKTGVELSIKNYINKVLDDHIHQIPKYEATSNTINALAMPNYSKNPAGNKSIWCIETNSKSENYGSVEILALYHYREQGFPNGLHCEGSLPILLFVTLFWEELYDMHIPGAFVTPYQFAPGDLFTECFYENRREKIDMKLQIINNLNSESLSLLMETRFKTYSQYQSIMPTNLLKNSLELKEIVCCLGVVGVVGICKRLIDNFKLWKAGFPDLIVWNFSTQQHKIVEVKGPRDVLSTKQRLWLEYLNQLGLSTEVCLVQDKCSARRSQKKTQKLNDYE